MSSEKQLPLDLNAEMIVDNFAGGGGASTGIELALGRSPEIAVNHDPHALAMHRANHPQTLHLAEDVFHVDPVAVTKGRPVGLAHFSPDCTHHSKAKGGKPKEKRIRGLAWVALNWVNKVAPRVLTLENVEEFQDWCPLDVEGKAKQHLKGFTFRCFVGALHRRGYEVDWRLIRASGYNTATIRRRLFLVARRDGQPIVWPEATHAEPVKAKAQKLKRWRPTAEHIDWSLPCPSIFATRAEIWEQYGLRVKRPLAEASLRRIAKGVVRYAIEAKEPFIVSLTHQGSDRVEPISEPIRTITGANRGEKGLCVPVLTEHANGSSQRIFNADEPLRTQCAEVKGGHFAMCMAKCYGGVVGQPMSAPLGTVTTVDHHAVISAHLSRQFGQSVGQGCDAAAPTVMPHGLGKTSLVASHLVKMRGDPQNHPARPMGAPLDTISAQGLHHGEVRCLLTKYYGTDQDPNLNEPLHTATTRDRFCLVRANLLWWDPALEAAARRVAEFLRTYSDWEGEFAIVGDRVMTDIGMRMLSARELFLCQGFPPSYIIERGLYPRQEGGYEWHSLNKTQQIRMCGNSVCPEPYAEILRVNVPELAVKGVAA